MSASSETLEVYFRSETFDEGSVPDKLLRDHALKEGVFGRIVVQEGEVEFWLDSDPPTMEVVRPWDLRLRVQPGQRHWVALRPGARFHLELLREPRA
ncbi:MAG: DUF1971 domain-containing protein [Myxococcota bacterium]